MPLWIPVRCLLGTAAINTYWNTYSSRRFGLLSMNPCKHFSKLHLQVFILGTLVEFAHKVSSCPQRVAGELQRGEAQVL